MIDDVDTAPPSGEAPEEVEQRLERIGVLRVGDTRLGIAASGCSGLIDLSRLTSLPRSPDYVLGVVLLRGRIVPVLDAGELLGIRRGGTYALGLVMSSEGGIGVLAVDEMVGFEPHDMLTLAAGDGAVPPAMQPFILGVLGAGEARTVVLDVGALFAALRAPFDAAGARPSRGEPVHDRDQLTTGSPPCG